MILLALICSAFSFPKMLFKERMFPVKPAPDRTAWQHEESWFHNMKNLSTESLRADCQWWSKFLSFLIALLSISLVGVLL